MRSIITCELTTHTLFICLLHVHIYCSPVSSGSLWKAVMKLYPAPEAPLTLAAMYSCGFAGPIFLIFSLWTGGNYFIISLFSFVINVHFGVKRNHKKVCEITWSQLYRPSLIGCVVSHIFLFKPHRKFSLTCSSKIFTIIHFNILVKIRHSMCTNAWYKWNHFDRVRKTTILQSTVTKIFS